MKKIVLIEDSADVRETTKEILELANYDVFVADNGKNGVKLIKKEKPDLVLCDIMMPDLDGYGVLRILLGNPETQNIPFIYLTSKTEKVDIRKGMNMGADDYLTKPFEETELLEAIEIRIQRNERFKQHSATSYDGLNAFIDEARGIGGLENLAKDSKTRKYEKREIIYREGDHCHYLYFIIKGKAKCVKSDAHSKDFVSSIHGKGEFIGYTTLLEGKIYHESTIALEPTEVSMIPKQDFLDLIYKNRDVAAKFLKILSGNVKDRERRLLQLAYSPLRERIADTILTLSRNEVRRNGLSGKISITRIDMANIVGTAKESLIRVLSQLKKEGLVDTNGQEIWITDEEGLKKAAHGF